MNTPEELFYTKSDEWLRLESDGTVTIGITDYAQHELGEIVYVELPAVGDRISESASFGVVESVKAVGELHSPLSGQVVAINEQTVNNSALVNESPYENGWLIRIKTETEPEFGDLLNAATYALLHS